MTGGALRLVSLTKSFGDVVAVDGIDLDLPAGEFCSLLGASGCGKTTTLRMIAGFERPDAGRLVRPDFTQRQLKSRGLLRGAWKGHIHRPRVTIRQAGRSRDDQHPLAPGDELGFEHEEGYSAEMIAVKVRNQDRVDGIGVDPQSLHRHGRGRLAIESRRLRRLLPQ